MIYLLRIISTPSMPSESMSGDNIKNLPVSKDARPKPGDLEFVYNLFQPVNKEIIKKAVSPFMLAFVGAIIFGVLSLPFFSNLAKKCTGSSLSAQLVLMFAFLVFFFIASRILK